MTTTGTCFPTSKITPFIHLIRSKPVLLDSDLAALFKVETRVLNQAIRRNQNRFPQTLVFTLTDKEAAKVSSSRSQSVSLHGGRGSNLKYLPFAFTEAGALMAASVLSSDHAVKIGPSIVRAFVKLEQKQKQPRQLRINRWNYSRIDEIHALIYNKTYPTIEDLMAAVKASRRTVCRDLRYIDSHKNLPLAVSRKAGREGLYYSSYENVPKKLIHTFTEVEFFNHFLADRSLSQVPVKGKQKLGLNMDDLGDLVDERTRKMLDELDGTMYFRPFAPEEIHVETFYALQDAVRQRYVLEFDYLKHMADVPEHKFVAPYCFTCAANSWYLIGLDVRVNQLRTYMLSRLSSPAITSEKFTKPKDFDINEYFDGAFIVMGGNESHDVVIEFDRWASAYIRNRQFTRDQKIEEQSHGGLRISFHVKCLEEVEAWVCYWRQHAKVISPRPLQERLFSYGQFLTKTYGPILTATADTV